MSTSTLPQHMVLQLTSTQVLTAPTQIHSTTRGPTPSHSPTTRHSPSTMWAEVTARPRAALPTCPPTSPTTTVAHAISRQSSASSRSASATCLRARPRLSSTRPTGRLVRIHATCSVSGCFLAQSHLAPRTRSVTDPLPSYATDRPRHQVRPHRAPA